MAEKPISPGSRKEPGWSFRKKLAESSAGFAGAISAD